MLYSVLGTFGRQILTLLLNLLTISILSKALGASGFGEYSLLIAAIAVGGPVFYFSMPSVVIHFSGKSDIISRGELYGSAVYLFFLCSVILIAVCFLAYYYVEFLHVNYSVSVVFFVCVAIILQGGNALCESFILAAAKYKEYNLIQLIPPSILLFSVKVLLPENFKWNLALMAYVFSYLVAFVCYLFVAKNTINIIVFKCTKNLKDTFFGYGLKMWGANLVTTILYRLPIFVVGKFLDPNSVGVYSACTQFSEKLWMPGRSFAAILFPERSINSKNWSKSIFVGGLKTVFINMLLVLLLAVILYYVFDLYGEVIFGDGFGSVVAVLIALTPGTVAWGGVIILGAELAARGESGANLISSLAAVIVFAMGSLLLKFNNLTEFAYLVSGAYTAGFLFSMFFYIRSYKNSLANKRS